jgi:glutamyl-tRNA synthetase/nondiscriminating glutamyl-tRNA synthetase
MKAAASSRLAAESVRYLMARGFVTRRTEEAMEFISQILPMAIGSVDRLDEVPERLKFLFEFDPSAALTKPEVAEVIHSDGARDVIAGFADELREAGRLDRESFRAAANRVKDRSGHKGKALFHPIRLAVTGAAEGLELDLAVPAIETGALLAESGIRRISSARERAADFANQLAAL